MSNELLTGAPLHRAYADMLDNGPKLEMLPVPYGKWELATGVYLGYYYRFAPLKKKVRYTVAVALPECLGEDVRVGFPLQVVFEATPLGVKRTLATQLPAYYYAQFRVYATEADAQIHSDAMVRIEEREE